MTSHFTYNVYFKIIASFCFVYVCVRVFIYIYFVDGFASLIRYCFYLKHHCLYNLSTCLLIFYHGFVYFNYYLSRNSWGVFWVIFSVLSTAWWFCCSGPRIVEFGHYIMSIFTWKLMYCFSVNDGIDTIFGRINNMSLLDPGKAQCDLSNSSHSKCFLIFSSKLSSFVFDFHQNLMLLL